MHMLPHGSVSFRRKATIAAGFGGAWLTAIAMLGPAGGFVSLIFAPLVVVATMTPAPNIRNAAPVQSRNVILGTLSRFLGQVGFPTIAMSIEIDDHEQLEDLYGRDAFETALAFTHTSIEEVLTDLDVTVRLDGPRFVCALAPQAPLETETMLNTCTRIQHALADVPHMTDIPVQITASIGFASSDRLAKPTAEGVLQAAFIALSEARRNRPGAVRAYSDAILSKRVLQHRMTSDARRAFEADEIVAYFQPQLDLKTGDLSGFEALSRWQHPVRGALSPGEFLPAFEQAGLMPKLGEAIIKQSLEALIYWDRQGLIVPHVGVNLSTDELRNPRLVDRIAMQLDRFDIAPERLVIEVLETVVASDTDDDILGNLAALADLGCGVDLDDFGTGYASITNIRRFSVGRIKIDRSFITGLDCDPEQRHMVAAILTMAERLGVKTLAEGVETRGQRDVLRRMGCDDVQGFQIARPMPLQETVDWATAYFQHVDAPVHLSKQAG